MGQIPGVVLVLERFRGQYCCATALRVAPTDRGTEVLYGGTNSGDLEYLAKVMNENFRARQQPGPYSPHYRPTRSTYDLCYRPTRSNCELCYRPTRTVHALPSTDALYRPRTEALCKLLRVCYAMCGTELGRGGTAGGMPALVPVEGASVAVLLGQMSDALTMAKQILQYRVLGRLVLERHGCYSTRGCVYVIRCSTILLEHGPVPSCGTEYRPGGTRRCYRAVRLPAQY
eukprot:3340754-Rhodomonas_salina.1